MTADTGPVVERKDLRSLATRANVLRVLFTLGALIIYRFGAHWPAAGLNPEAVYSKYSSASLLEMRVQILSSSFALGLNPILTVLIAAEVLKLALPQFSMWLRSKPGLASTYWTWVWRSVCC